MLVCMVMNSLPLAFEGDLSVAMDKSLARRNVENKSLGAGSQTGASLSPSLSSDLNQPRFMIWINASFGQRNGRWDKWCLVLKPS